MDSHPAADLDAVLRWERFGGTWSVLSRTAAEAVLSLRRCDAGEEAGQLVLTSADGLAWLDAQSAPPPPV